MDVATAADHGYFGRLLNLIGSLHRNAASDFGRIMVYDIGLLPEQRRELASAPRVVVCDVERLNPDITTPLPKHPLARSRTAPGLYSWKPVAIKQSLDRSEMVLWLDAGTVVLKSLMPIVNHVRETGSFLIQAAAIGKMLNRYPRDKLSVTKEELERRGIASGVQCLDHTYYDSYVMPAYECCRDIGMFVDDGTTPRGPKGGMHDQSLFSVFAVRSGMTIFPLPDIELASGAKIRITHLRDQVNDQTAIYVERGNRLAPRKWE